METKLYNGTSRKIPKTSVAVDPEKFRVLIKKRGMTLTEMSKTLGYADNGVVNALHYGLFSGQLVVGLRAVYNIQPEEYQYVPPKEEPKEEPKQEEFVTHELCAHESMSVAGTPMYNTIKYAVMDAMELLVAELHSVLKQEMYDAIKQAVKDALEG